MSYIGAYLGVGACQGHYGMYMYMNVYLLLFRDNGLILCVLTLCIPIDSN